MEKLDMFITWNDDPNILYSKLYTFSSTLINNEIHYPLLFCAKSSLEGSKKFICLNPLVAEKGVFVAQMCQKIVPPLHSVLYNL